MWIPKLQLHFGGYTTFMRLLGQFLQKLEIPKKGASEIDRGKGDSHNCMEVYKAFKKLTPQQAYDERFWVFLSHSNEFLDYMRCRWPHKKNQSEDERIKHFKLHFFSQGNRGRTRNNGISRLWWLGYCTDKVVSSPEMKDIDQKRALELLFYRQDVRASLVERPGTAMCLNVFRAIVKMLHDSYETDDKDLFERKKFRSLMEKLNSQGGVVLYDALSVSQIIDLCERLLRSSND